MCGIYGHLKTEGEDNSATICIEGLKKLEYRGYDSAGLAGIFEGKLISYKSVGKVQLLEKKLEQNPTHLDVAIAHTRWATHGAVNLINAHPHFDHHKNIALVHNGVIENYLVLKEELMALGSRFHTDTDTEVVCELISHYYEGNILAAVQKTLARLHGAFAIALIHQDHPDTIIAAVRSCPLVVGICTKTRNIYLSSDSMAFLGKSLDVFYLNDEEVAELTRSKIEIVNAEGIRVHKIRERLSGDDLSISKEGYEHYLIKEIYEQPQAVSRVLANRVDFANATAFFEELTLTDAELIAIKDIVIVACGSAYHAGLIVAPLLQKEAMIPTRVEIASEFRYSNLFITQQTLVIAISQSGETADTLAAAREAKKYGAKVLALCNVPRSSLTRDADCTLWQKAGPEISVCSTKAFTNQVALLMLFAIKFARLRTMSFAKGIELLMQLQKVPEILQEVLRKNEEIKDLAKKYSHFEHYFFIGRQSMYSTALEASLKFKEITYNNAFAYPAGELKHGPIALISSEVPTIAFGGSLNTFDKLLSNLMEIKSRNGPILAFAPKGKKEILSITDDVIFLPILPDSLAIFPYAIAAQLLAYHSAYLLGRDIDQPRNLAKSVTVE